MTLESRALAAPNSRDWSHMSDFSASSGEARTLSRRLRPVEHVITIRSSRGRIGSAVVAGLGALFLGIVVYSDGPRQALYTLPWILLVVFGIWWAWTWPRLILAPGGVVARNHLRTIRIPWARLRQCETDFGLYLHTATKRYYVAAVPARGGLLQARRRAAPEPPALDFVRSIRPTIEAEPQIAARLVDAERDAHLHTDQQPRYSSDEQSAIREQLRARPIDPRLGSRFPPEPRVEMSVIPAAVTLILAAASIATTWVL